MNWESIGFCLSEKKQVVRFRHNLDAATKQLVQDIQAHTRRELRSLDRVIREQATLLRNDIVTGWPVETGASRAAWQGPFKEGPASYVLRNNMVYAAVIEFGGYRGVGPKTAQVGAFFLPGGIGVNGGIYPTQRPAAPVRQGLSKRQLALARAIT